MKGRFIVLEGIDGCGKTTQIHSLAKWLPNSGLMRKGSKVKLTKEPGGTKLGETLRELLLHPSKEITPGHLAELLLYAADRAQHVSELILPTLNQGDWVISDRFSGSTIAYQGYGRKLNLEIIKQLEGIATSGIKPDITFLLNISVETSLNRRQTNKNDRIEEEGKDFLEKVALGFSLLAKERNWISIPGELSNNLVSRKIEEELIKHLIPNKGLSD